MASSDSTSMAVTCARRCGHCKKKRCRDITINTVNTTIMITVTAAPHLAFENGEAGLEGVGRRQG
jgi:hypothetical protein